MKARQAALTALAKSREQVASWQQRRSQAQAELARLCDTAGSELLSDDDAAERVARDMQRQRDLIDMAARAIDAAEAEGHTAAVAAVLAEADEVDVVVEQRQRRLDAHEARTAELLAQLEEHEGRFISVDEAAWRTPKPQPGQPSINDGAPVPRSVGLRRAVDEVRLSAAILRYVAAGGDARSVGRDGQVTDQVGGMTRPLGPEDYPASVYGPDAVLPCPEYLRAVQGAQGRLSSLDADAASLQGRLAALDAELEQLGGTDPRRRVKEASADLLRRQLAEIPGRRTASEEALASLTAG